MYKSVLKTMAQRNATDAQYSRLGLQKTQACTCFYQAWSF